MEELTNEKKLDFIDFCMGKIDGRYFSFFTCNEMEWYFNVRHDEGSEDTALLLFPEMLKYSIGEEKIEFFDSDGAKENNATRAIIYAFLWLELTGEIKV